MAKLAPRTVCWRQLWNERLKGKGAGVEHLLLSELGADSVLIAFDEDHGPFRLNYRLTWDENWQIREARLHVVSEYYTRWLTLLTDGRGQWHDAGGEALPDLDGCLDIDIWPTPFTNSFPMRRESLSIGERKEFRMAWIFAPDLSVKPQAQAYTRVEGGLYLFESLDGSGFTAKLPVDEDRIVLDYPELFERVRDEA
jgi:hypothetical protein